MRRMFAWSLGALAFAGMNASAPAQSYGYQQPTQYPAYGYAPAPMLRAMPAPNYVVPQPGYYGYAPGMVPMMRPATPVYYSRPGYVPLAPSYVTSAPLTAQGAPTPARSGEPVVVIKENNPVPGASSIPKALPAGEGPGSSSTAVTTTITEAVPPPVVPSHIPGIVSEEMVGACPPSPYVHAFRREPDPKCNWMLGGGAMYLRANNENNRAFTNADFDDEWDIAPYAWIAFVGKNGFGVRARGWYFRQETSLAAANTTGGVVGIDGLNINSAAAGDTLAANNTLRMYVGDVEAILKTDWSWCTLVFAAGARYADIQQEREGRVQGILNASGVSENDFRAVGPTFAIEGSRGFGKCFAVYLNGRASFLFGTRRFDQQLTAGAGNFALSVEDDDIISAVEVEAGVQYAVKCGEGGHFVIRAGVTAQRWIDLGSSVNRTGDLDLFGGILQAGFHY